MKQEMKPEIGSVVISNAGRDAGRPFLVVGTEHGLYLLADGKLRRAERPKRKKGMHLKAQQARAEALAGKITRGESVSDAEIRKALKELGYDSKEESEEE